VSITYLAKLGELTLKGLNRREFERRLVENARFALSVVPDVSARLRAGRMYIEGPEEAAPAVESALTRLIGITGWARSAVCDKNIEAIRETAYLQALNAKAAGAKSFKIETRRADKSFPLNSYQVCAEAPSRIVEEGLLAVDVHRPDAVINIEIREKCFVYTNARRSCRGLPVGSSGKGLLLLSGGIDSPVAGYRMLRRGMRIDSVYFHAAPYTSEEARKKVEDLAQILALYGLDTHLNIIPFTAVQMRIKERSPAPFTTLLLRVCMVKAANLLADRTGAQCLITGESLGQVASQTNENLRVTENASWYPIYRPLIGMDKEEIIETARAIGAYETSILPYDDCCVLFSPRHPVLRADVREAQELYEKLDIDSLIQDAFERREIKRFTARPFPHPPFSAKISP
jgi:thiamine biosynthesis protein ThiI